MSAFKAMVHKFESPKVLYILILTYCICSYIYFCQCDTRLRVVLYIYTTTLRLMWVCPVVTAIEKAVQLLSSTHIFSHN